MRKTDLDSLLRYLKDTQKESLDFLKQLIGFDSQIISDGKKGNEKEIQEFIAQFLEESGIEVDKFEPDNELIKDYEGFNADHDYTDRPNVVGILKGSGKGRSLILNGHCDVVAPGNLDSWNTPPFKACVEEDKLYGRGSCDMKAGLASVLWVVSAIKKLGINVSGDVFIQSVVDEEGGGNGTLACVARGYKADGALIAEPTSLDIHIANRGALLGEIKVKGKPVHASMRGFGVNAIEKAYKLISALKNLETTWLTTVNHPFLLAPTINIGEISGGTGASIVPDECIVRFDAEFLPREAIAELQNKPVIDPDKEGVKKAIEQLVADVCQGDAWLRENPVVVNWYQDTSVFYRPKDHELPVTLVDSISEEGQSIEFSGLASGCDAVYLEKYGKTPTVVFGPGSIMHAHAFNEFVPISEFFKHQEILAKFILKWTSGN